MKITEIDKPIRNKYKDEILSILKSIYFATYPDLDLGPENSKLVDEKVEAILMSDSPMLGGWEGDNLVGIILYESVCAFDIKIVKLLQIGVSSRFRRKGKGKLLLDLFVDLMKERGAHKVELIVGSSNEAALRLYRSYGFNVFKYSMELKL